MLPEILSQRRVLAAGRRAAAVQERRSSRYDDDAQPDRRQVRQHDHQEPQAAALPRGAGDHRRRRRRSRTPTAPKRIGDYPPRGRRAARTQMNDARQAAPEAPPRAGADRARPAGGRAGARRGGQGHRRRAGGPELHAHADRDVHGRGERGGRAAARFAGRAVPPPHRTPSRSCRTPSGCGTFVQVAGLQAAEGPGPQGASSSCSRACKGKPEAFAINLAVLKSLTRAEYSPEPIGHYALASEHYCHFTSPIRRYADLTVHRLLDAYFDATRRRRRRARAASGGRKRKIVLRRRPELRRPGRDRPAHQLHRAPQPRTPSASCGRSRSSSCCRSTSARSSPASSPASPTSASSCSSRQYLIDGLIRYEDLMDDWWDVDASAGSIRGQRTGTEDRHRRRRAR